MTAFSFEGWYELTTQLPLSLSDYSIKFDTSSQLAYLSGGIIYDSNEQYSATNGFYQISFNFTEYSDNSHNFLEINNINDFSSYYHLLWNGMIEYDLEEFYNTHQISNGAGFYNHKIFVYSPHYTSDINTLYIITCDHNDNFHCNIHDTSDTNDININNTITNKNDGNHNFYYQPCTVQNNNLIYLIGGTYSSENSNDIIVYDMNTNSFDWSLTNYNILPYDQVYQSCSICNNAIYTFGGTYDGNRYSDIIVKCDLDDTSGNIIECNELNDVTLSNPIENSRAVCIDNQIITIIGGDKSMSEHSKHVDIFDCDDETIISGPNLPYGLTSFQALTLNIPDINKNINYVCTFGGQSTDKKSRAIILDDINCFEITLEIFNDAINQPQTTNNINNDETIVSTTSNINDINEEDDDENKTGSLIQFKYNFNLITLIFIIGYWIYFI